MPQMPVGDHIRLGRDRPQRFAFEEHRVDREEVAGQQGARLTATSSG
jgi:hypothetical protein